MQKICFVDIDETLIFSRYKVPGSIPVEWDGTIDYTIVRESAYDFLKALKDKGYKIVMLTTGVVSWQKACLEALGLLDYFDDFHGYESVLRHDPGEYIPLREVTDWVLVDNYHCQSRNIWPKPKWLGGCDDEEHYVQCATFYGIPEGPDEALTTLLPEIYRKMGDE